MATQVEHGADLRARLMVQKSMSTLANEQQEFFRRLRSDPTFLLKHAPALAFSVFKKIRNRVSIALSATHHGRKTRPDWLPTEAIVTRQQRAGFTPNITALPIYECSSRTALKKSVGDAGARIAENDIEDYLAEHRWGFLLVSLLNDCAEWRKDFNVCIRWIANHSEKGDRMWEPYSACERVANLLIYIAATPLAMRTAEVPRQLSEFVDDSIDWIYQHLEYYGPSGTNNHILNNARALVLGGVAIGNRAAVSVGMTIFRNCLPVLIMSGGFLRERSSHYQLIVLNWMLDAWKFIAVEEGEESEDARFLHEFIQRAVRAASVLCESDAGLSVMIGDISPDVAPADSFARLTLLYPELWPVPRESRDEVEVTDGWFRISMAHDLIVGNFPAGRYPPSFPTHGHCDFTSFAWLHAGQEILGDSGRYRYTADAVSLFQKSAVGHNVPTINGFAPLSETLVANGLWWPLPYAAAELEAIGCDGGVALAHDGFARATPVARHTRRIIVRDSTLEVMDSFEGTGHVDLGLCWHFGEVFEGFDADSMVANGTWGRLTLRFEGAAGPPNIQPVFGAFPGGWASYRYGLKRPRLAICLRWTVRLPFAVSTRFVLTVAGVQK